MMCICDYQKYLNSCLRLSLSVVVVLFYMTKKKRKKNAKLHEKRSICRDIKIINYISVSSTDTEYMN